MIDPDDFQPIFHPRSIAVIGASNDPIKFGGQTYAALKLRRYRGRLYAVNPSATEVDGPSNSVMDLKAKSVKKKWKDKRFAAGVDRAIIDRGAEMLGMDRTELITETIMGMRDVADAIGLKGTL